MERKVGIFVVGAGKAGTTWLQACFDEHPGLYVHPKKELNYFSLDYNKPDITYADYFTEANTNQLLADVSPTYLSEEESPERIHKYNPNAKIIIKLRNPVNRAFSHYNMLRRGNDVTVNMLEEITNNKTHLSKSMLNGGKYFTQVKNYQKYFKPENILILFYEDLKKDAVSYWKRVLYFIEADPTFQPSMLTQKYHKTKNLPRNQTFYNSSVNLYKKIYSSVPLLKPGLDWIKTSGAITVFHKLNDSGKKPMMNQQVKSALIDFYTEEVKGLEKLLDKDLSHWLK